MPRLIDRKTATRLLVLSALGAIAPITFLFGNCLSIDALYHFPHWIVFVWPTSLVLLGVSGSSCPDSGFLMAMAFSLVGIEVKYADAPSMTRSMHVSIESLKLDRLYVVYPGAEAYALRPGLEVLPLPLARERIIAARDKLLPRR